MSDEKTTPTPAAFANLSRFTPKAPTDERLSKEALEDMSKVGEANGFLSREAVPAKTDGRHNHYNKVGPIKQLNIKMPESLHQRFYETAKRRGTARLWDLLTDALDALDAAEAAEKQKD
ncbi:stability/partitioning determinant [Pseudomonas viridiflava]|uniref:stability/partitioning determinant n=1 Tax=Pseudomonas viridiflava TaxID=33069 RepID=UPI000F02AE3A|nr:stability/partitioning determinant [Pseudomonas viridiflava]